MTYSRKCLKAYEISAIPAPKANHYFPALFGISPQATKDAVEVLRRPPETRAARHRSGASTHPPELRAIAQYNYWPQTLEPVVQT